MNRKQISQLTDEKLDSEIERAKQEEDFILTKLLDERIKRLQEKMRIAKERLKSSNKRIAELDAIKVRLDKLKQQKQ